jgi:hypothetical protein
MMIDSNMTEFEASLREICLTQGWIPSKEDCEDLDKGILDEIDAFFVANWFSVTTESFYKSKFIKVTFMHKPSYPNLAEFAAEGETWRDAMIKIISKVNQYILDTAAAQ